MDTTSMFSGQDMATMVAEPLSTSTILLAVMWPLCPVMAPQVKADILSLPSSQITLVSGLCTVTLVGTWPWALPYNSSKAKRRSRIPSPTLAS